MASKEKVSLAQLKVGILGIVALFFITLLIFLLTGSTQWFKKQIELHAYVSDAAGLTPGAPVRINGIQAGNVDNVSLSGLSDPKRIIKLDFRVNEDMLKQIPVDSIVSIASDNILGSTKFLQIDKGSSSQTVQANATLNASSTKEFNALVEQGYGVLDSLQAILGRVEQIVGQVQGGQGTIGKLLVDNTMYNTLQATADQVQRLATTLNSKTGTLGRLLNDDTLYIQAQTTLNRMDQITQGLQQGQGTAGLFLKDAKLYNDIDTSVKQLNSILADLNAGKGTAGELLKSDKVAQQLSTTLDKLNSTLDKVNSGDGTIGQLMVNPQLYDAMNGTTRELHSLLQDFRSNPKKFLSIRLHIF